MDLNGLWYNELGSEMTLTVKNGAISGTFETFVSTCAKGKYFLAGRSDTNTTGTPSNLGFVVSWENEQANCDSVTSWSGEVQTIDGEEIIVAFWLLTMETNPNDDWKSTLIGKDVFSRNKPAPTAIDAKKKLKPFSHPL